LYVANCFLEFLFDRLKTNSDSLVYGLGPNLEDIKILSLKTCHSFNRSFQPSLKPTPFIKPNPLQSPLNQSENSLSSLKRAPNSAMTSTMGPGDEELVKCRALLKDFEQKPETEPFLEAVDWKSLNLPDYPQIIKKAMDLGTIQVSTLTQLSLRNYYHSYCVLFAIFYAHFASMHGTSIPFFFEIIGLYSNLPL